MGRISRVIKTAQRPAVTRAYKKAGINKAYAKKMSKIATGGPSRKRTKAIKAETRVATKGLKKIGVTGNNPKSLVKVYAHPKKVVRAQRAGTRAGAKAAFGRKAFAPKKSKKRTGLFSTRRHP